MLDRIRHLVGLAVADTDTALAVTHDSQRGERETAPALYDFGAPVDEDHLLDHRGAFTLGGFLTGVTTAGVAARPAGTGSAGSAARFALGTLRGRNHDSFRGRCC